MFEDWQGSQGIEYVGENIDQRGTDNMELMLRISPFLLWVKQETLARLKI